MTEELEEMCCRMKLFDEELCPFQIKKDAVAKSKQEAQFSLLFKLLSNRLYNMEAFKGMVRSLWQSTGGLLIRDISDNLFMVVFNSKDDLEHVCVRSPWTFDKKLI